jgi:hypothetical protein
MKKEVYFKKSYKIFINSFKKIDLRIFFIVFFDLVFYFLVFLIGISTKIIFENYLYANLPQILSQLENPLQLGEESLRDLLSNLRWFLFFLVVMAVLPLIIIIIDWSIFKGVAWGLTIKRKFNFKFFLRFFLLNLAWLGLFVILIFLFAFAFKRTALPIYMSILLIIWIYFTNIIYTLFIKNPNIKSIKKAFKLGFTKIHYFTLPYFILVLILIIIYFIMNLITLLPYGIGFTIMILMLLFYLAWARFYIVDVIESF